MSFFKKLRDRMFRSSDKIGEGLDALVTQTPDATAPDKPGLLGRIFGAGDEPRRVLDDALAPEPLEAPPRDRPGLWGRILGAGAEPRRVLDDAMLENLEEVLIKADMGVDTAVRVTANIAEGRFGKRVSSAELRGALATEIARIMGPVARPLPLYPQKPQVVLVVGVNGSGKTTTIGKLASQFKAAGKW